MKKFLSLAAFMLLLLCFSLAVQAQDEEQDQVRERATTAAVKRLSSIDPLTRQRAAEELAQLTATEKMRLVEGYRLQEKDKRVRLALDWALYRMGKNEKLYEVVQELGTSRKAQAQIYLTQLDNPALLHPFLRWDDKVLVGLLEVFARIGDTETLKKIEPYTKVVDKKIVETAEYAIDEINKRLVQPQTPKQTRPRIAGSEKPKR
jgi:hypothetical protein